MMLQGIRENTKNSQNEKRKAPKHLPEVFVSFFLFFCLLVLQCDNLFKKH